MALKTFYETTPWSDANKNPGIWPLGWRDRTVGTYFVVTAVDSVIWGIRCYWPTDAVVTLRCHLYEPNNAAPIVTKDFAMAGMGWYSLEFDAPKLVVTGAAYTMQDAVVSVAAGRYCVTLYETTGVYVPRGSAVPVPFLAPGRQTCFFSGPDTYISAIGSGDIKPTVASDRCYVDPIIYGNYDLADPDPPFLHSLHPDAYSYLNPRDGYVAMDIVDLDTGVDGYSILVKIRNSVGDLIPAYDGYTDTFYNPFNSPLSDAYFGTFDGYDGYRIIFHRITDFPSYRKVDIHAHAKDNAGNILDGYYYFHIEDYEPPVYYSPSIHPPRQNPEITGQSENTWIRAGIYDKGSGIDGASIHVYIDGIDAYDSSSKLFTPGYDVWSTCHTHVYDGYDGYEITIYKNTRYKSGDTISVEVYATDNEGN